MNLHPLNTHMYTPLPAPYLYAPSLPRRSLVSHSYGPSMAFLGSTTINVFRILDTGIGSVLLFIPYI